MSFVTRRFLSFVLPGAILVLLVAAFVSCDVAGSESEDDGAPPDTVIEGVNFTTLFAPPAETEIRAVTDEWAERDVSADLVGVEDVPLPDSTADRFDAELQLLTHEVPSPDGEPVRHVGATLVPNDPAQSADLPILVFAHGGDSGADLAEFLQIMDGVVSSPGNVTHICDRFADCSGDPEEDRVTALRAFVRTAIHVIPAFRSEAIRFDDEPLAVADGAPSPWDYDVDDTFALVNTAIDRYDVLSDDSPVVVVGASRGGGVALLMSVRDDVTPDTPDVVATVDFFGGPTSLFSPFARDVTEAVLTGDQRVLSLPGVSYLKDALIDPMKEGELSEEETRPFIIRRSAALFPDRLDEALQVHHGVEDPIVPVHQSRLLADTLANAGLTPDPSDDDPFHYFEYEPVDDPSVYPGYDSQADQHNPFLLDDDSDPENGIASVERAGRFLFPFLFPSE